MPLTKPYQEKQETLQIGFQIIFFILYISLTTLFVNSLKVHVLEYSKIHYKLTELEAPASQLLPSLLPSYIFL